MGVREMQPKSVEDSQYIELACGEKFQVDMQPAPAEIAFEFHRSFMIDSSLMS